MPFGYFYLIHHGRSFAKKATSPDTLRKPESRSRKASSSAALAGNFKLKSGSDTTTIIAMKLFSKFQM
jgi:hypothetical protein